MTKVFIVVGCFILFDVATGLLKALHDGKLNSTPARKGLYHKLSELLAVVGSALLEYGVDFINLGVDVPFLGVVASYICIMELISILENLCAVNPSLCKLFKPYLEKLKDRGSDSNEVAR